MNRRDISIQPDESGFRTFYQEHAILWSNVHYNLGTIVFCDKAGNTITHDLSRFLELGVYNSQFGILLTDDGSKFFVQSWESGLFCFETQTGKLLWHLRQKRASSLATDAKSVICHFSGQCISKIDGLTGSVLRCYSYTTGTMMYALSPRYYLVGPKRNQYEILNENLEIRAKVPVAQLNPYSYDSFLIQDASLADGKLVVSGIEYRSEEMRNARKDKSTDLLLEKSRFARAIQVCIQ